MPVIAVDRSLMTRLLLPSVPLAVGRTLMARVIAAGDGRATLSIAGWTLDAQAPAGLRSGQELALTVSELHESRVLLSIGHPAADAPVAAQAGLPVPAPLAAPVPLPGGLTLRVSDDDAGGGGPGRGRGGDGDGGGALSLRLSGPGLGDVDLRLALDPATLRVTVTLDPGEALQRASAAAAALREELTAGATRAVAVDVVARRRPVDVRA